jgi:hypothetical protein
VIVVQTIYCEQSIFQRNPILSEMSIAYDDLSSTGTPLSIFPLANDYLMSGHSERDKQDVRDKRDTKFEVLDSKFRIRRTSNSPLSRFSRKSRESRANHEIRVTRNERQRKGLEEASI